MLYEQQQLMNTLLEQMKDQPTSGVPLEVLNITNNSSNSIPVDVGVRNEIDFHIGCTTATTTSCSISSFNYSQPNYNEDNSNKETHETSDRKENDGHSNQDSTSHCEGYHKQKSNETSSCAQDAHQKSPYYRPIYSPKTQCTSYCK